MRKRIDEVDEEEIIHLDAELETGDYAIETESDIEKVNKLNIGELNEQ